MLRDPCITLFFFVTKKPFFVTTNSNGQYLNLIQSTKTLATNGKWDHLASVYKKNGSFYTLYLNGNAVLTQTSVYPISNVTRTSNYIGRSNFKDIYQNTDADADLDDIKIYKRALSLSEILFDFYDFQNN